MTASDPPTFTSETIRTAVFKSALRGYRRDDVDGFMRDLADHVQVQRAGLAELEREQARLKARVAELESPGAQAAREVAGCAMLSAQQASDELLGRTRSLCDELIQAARTEADAVAARAEARGYGRSRPSSSSAERGGRNLLPRTPCSSTQPVTRPASTSRTWSGKLSSSLVDLRSAEPPCMIPAQWSTP